MVTFLLIAAVTILVFLCFIGPDGPTGRLKSDSTKRERYMW